MNEHPDGSARPAGPPQPLDDNTYADGLTPSARPPRPAGGDGAPLDPAAEETIWTGRTNWRHYWGTVALGILIVVFAWVALWILGRRNALSGSTAFLIGVVVAALAILGFGGCVTLHVLQRRYRLTGQRLFIEKGILTQTIDQMELIRVDDVRVRKPLMDRLFGLGSVEILSTDASDRTVLIEGVADSDRIAEHVRTRMRKLRSRSLFVENL